MSEEPPPPPYEYPAYQGQGQPPSAPTQGYPGHPGYGTDQGYPGQNPAGYPPQQYPGYYGDNETDKERAPLVTSAQQQTIIIPASIVWGRYPLQTVCGNCGNAILTEIEHVAGTFTWLIAGIILLIGGWLMCCLIPFFADSCKDVQHKCPNCKMLIHTWTRL
ncbi:hypothetical protein ACHWQZ_G016749 [Mnemiopsis leidyi]